MEVTIRRNSGAVRPGRTLTGAAGGKRRSRAERREYIALRRGDLVHRDSSAPPRTR